MKKKVMKLTLNRETLCSLDGLRSTLGAADSFVCTHTHPCSLTCGLRCVTDTSDPCTDGTSACPTFLC